MVNPFTESEPTTIDFDADLVSADTATGAR